MKRPTMPIRAAYGRLHQKYRAQKRAVAGLQEVNNHLHGEVMSLRSKLRQRHAVELPETFLTKVMNRFVEQVADHFVKLALQEGARIHHRVLVEAAQFLVERGMRRHTVCTTPRIMELLADDAMEDGGMRFTFSTNGPVSCHYQLHKDKLAETQPYHRYIARDGHERFYRMDALHTFVADYLIEPERSLKPHNLFYSH